MSVGSGLGGGTQVELDPEAALEQPHADAADRRRGDDMAGKSPSAIALGRLRRDPVAMMSLGVVIFFVLVAVFAPLLARLEGQDTQTFNFDLLGDNNLPTFVASKDHWFGVEANIGRDLFARWVYGARPSLIIATVAALASTVIGVVAGLVSGFLGGWVDRVISWVVDFFLSLPFLLMIFAIVPIAVSWFGTAETVTSDLVGRIRFISLICVLVVFGWMTLARLIRGEVISLREREFVQAARALGVPTRRILFKEMLPNMLGTIIVNTSIAIPAYVSLEAGLSFLGVGLTEPTPSWGLTIAQATTSFREDPLYLWLPVFGIALLVLSLSLLGDAISDAFNPHTRR
jgi:peptide/nickel transport system permease protein